MQQVISRTQPALEHSYSAIQVDGETRTERTVVYRGYEGGKHIIDIGGGNYYRAKRTSEDEMEPVFEFGVNDQVQ